MARLKYTPSQFYGIEGVTPLEFHNAMVAWNEEKEADYRVEDNTKKAVYDAMRIQTMFIHNFLCTDENKMLSDPKTLMIFSFEEEDLKKEQLEKRKKVKKQSVEEMKSILYAFAGKPMPKEGKG
jgi:hypothetical protein